MQKEPYRVGTVSPAEAWPLLVEMVIRLQASTDALAYLICESQVVDLLTATDLAANELQEQEGIDVHFQNYKARVAEEARNYGFELSERFPLHTEGANEGYGR